MHSFMGLTEYLINCSYLLTVIPTSVEGCRCAIGAVLPQNDTTNIIKRNTMSTNNIMGSMYPYQICLVVYSACVSLLH